jgi:hypothetical protein
VDNQLKEVTSFLKEHYPKADKVMELAFSWRGIAQSNLIVVIKGG